jgi:cytochrome c oxidase cbb3-type subunit I/II
VHAGTLWWNGFVIFGMLYWLVPRLWRTELHSRKMATAHFWMGTLGIAGYLIAIYTAGITQGLMWRAFDASGRLMYPDFVETVVRIIPFWILRAASGTLYLAGVLLMMYNFARTIAAAPKELPDQEASAPPLRPWSEELAEGQPAALQPGTYDLLLHRVSKAISHGLHRALEAMPVTLTVLSFLAIAVGSLIEIVPTLLVKSNIPSIASVKPLTGLELEGRDVYLAEGCYNCHSQMIRPCGDRALRRLLQARRVDLRSPVPVGVAKDRSGPGARGQQVPAPLACAPHGGSSVHLAGLHHARVSVAPGRASRSGPHGRQAAAYDESRCPLQPGPDRLCVA